MRKSRFTEAQIIRCPAGDCEAICREGDDQRAESRDADSGGVPPTRPEPGDLLQTEVQVWRHRGIGGHG